ncbi:FliH/SctL family protein [Crenobacter intestini]|uniref:Flagellar assembly protein FliH n=1 Tax=Crenobacter intestini TaxID=2563443 RepID=A0A4V4N7Q1_9NEIS|nr:FliH/SctL family protein [Crenobacter intestini]TIC81423.1 hypothetical protein E5K04_10925 [Crenobacter intestini]
MSSNPIIGADELGAWQRWTMGELGGAGRGKAVQGAPQDARALLSGVSAEALVRALDGAAAAVAVPDAPQAPVETPEPVLAEAAPAVGYPTAAELEAIHQEAWQAGFEAGHGEGAAAGRAEGEQQGLEQGLAEGQRQAEAQAAERFAAMWAPLQATLDDWSDGLAALQGTLAPQLAALALEIGQRLAGEQLQADPQALGRLVDEALAPLSSELARLTVRVHPDDAAHLESFLSQNYPQLAVRWQGDASLARGGCVIDAPVVRLDLSLETRTAQLREALGLDIHG